MKLLALESSTSSAKAMLYDTETKISSVRIRQYPQMFDCSTVHNARTVFEQTMSVGEELLNGERDVEMIALSGTWHSVCLFDSDMEPQIPVLPWCYTGASDLCKKIRRDKNYVNDYYHKTGCMVNAIYPFFKLAKLKEEGYDLSSYLIAGQGVYNTYRMTGQRAITECTASGTGLMNIYTKKYEPVLLKELGISEQALPEVVAYNRTFPLIKEAAELLGLREGIPVIPSNSDGGLNQIGVGALKKGIMTCSVGTSGALRLTCQEPVIPEKPGTWCYLSPKSWISGAATSGACNCIEWFKKNFAGTMPYSELEKEFEQNIDLPVFLPFIFGERCPGWNDDRRGSFEQLEVTHTVQDLYKAVQEGILMNLYQCYETLTAINGIPERIKLSGGILNSPLWTQMCADIFNQEMELDEQPQSSLMGGIVLAMEVSGMIESIENFNVAPASVVKPIPERVEFYRQRYERYQELYEAHTAQQ